MRVCGPVSLGVPRKSQGSLGWKDTCSPSSPGSNLGSGRVLSSCLIQCCSPVLVERAFLVEAFVMGFHVAQAGVVVGVNEGQMNLEAEKEVAGGRGWDPGKKSTTRVEPTSSSSGPALVGREGLLCTLNETSAYSDQDSAPLFLPPRWPLWTYRNPDLARSAMRVSLFSLPSSFPPVAAETLPSSPSHLILSRNLCTLTCNLPPPWNNPLYYLLHSFFPSLTIAQGDLHPKPSQ